MEEPDLQYEPALHNGEEFSGFNQHTLFKAHSWACSAEDRGNQ